MLFRCKSNHAVHYEQPMSRGVALLAYLLLPAATFPRRTHTEEDDDASVFWRKKSATPVANQVLSLAS